MDGAGTAFRLPARCPEAGRAEPQLGVGDGGDRVGRLGDRRGLHHLANVQMARAEGPLTPCRYAVTTRPPRPAGWDTGLRNPSPRPRSTGTSSVGSWSPSPVAGGIKPFSATT